MKKRDNAYKFADEFMKFMANSYEKRSDYTSIGYKQSMTMFLDYAYYFIYQCTLLLLPTTFRKNPGSFQLCRGGHSVLKRLITFKLLCK